LFSSINDLKHGLSIFKEDGIDRLFSEDSVYTPLYETIEDMHEQLSKIFLERGKFLRPILDVFSKYYEDNKNIADIFIGFLALQSYLGNHQNNVKSANPEYQAFIDKDRQMLVQTFDPESLFFGTTNKDLLDMRKKYPQNEFLKLITSSDTRRRSKYTINGSTSLFENGVETKLSAGEKIIIVQSKSKLAKGDYVNKIVNDVESLFKSRDLADKLFVRNLFYGELARTGMQQKTGSFLNLLPQDLLVPVSKAIKNFISLSKLSENNDNSFIDNLQSFFNTNNAEDTYKTLDNLFIQLAMGAALEKNNKRIPGSTSIKLRKGLYDLLSEQDPKLQLEIVNKELDEIFQNTLPIKNDGNRLSFIEESLPNTFTMTLEKPEESDNPALMTKFLFNFGKINYNKPILDTDEASYTFPEILMLGSTIYLLSGIDGSIGKKVFEKLGKGEQYISKGFNATYMKVPKSFATSNISTLMFSKEQLLTMNNAIEDKGTLDYTAYRLRHGLGTVQTVSLNDRVTNKIGFDIEGISPQKNSKDAKKAAISTDIIEYGRDTTTRKSSSVKYGQAAVAQGIPRNSGNYNSNTVAMVTVSGNNVATKEDIENTAARIKEVLNAGGSIIMDNKINRESSWNISGEGAVWNLIKNSNLENISTDPDYVQIRNKKTVNDAINKDKKIGVVFYAEKNVAHYKDESKSTGYKQGYSVTAKPTEEQLELLNTEKIAPVIEEPIIEIKKVGKPVQLSLFDKINDDVKSGVSELFESNPELANAVYEALGFKNEQSLEVKNKKIYEPRQGFYYRGIGEDGLKDAIESGFFRSPTMRDTYKGIYKTSEIYWADANHFEVAKTSSIRTNGSIMEGKSIIVEYPSVPEIISKDRSVDNRTILDNYASQTNLPFGNARILIGDRKTGIYNYVDFNQITPQQIHILGSKEDIEGFRDFVNPNSFKTDLENLNLTYDVLKHLHENSSNTKTFDNFAESVNDLVNHLIAYKSTEEILDIIKCL
jgi:hypothetical protein